MRSYLKLFRLPNLLIIILTQVLARQCIFGTFYASSGLIPQMPITDFILLVIATVFIASAGYIINDCLDYNMDEINKPGNSVIGRSISEKQAYFLYYSLNIIGVVIGFYLSFRAHKIQLGIIFIIIATMLYYYSLKYKYLPIWGNLTVAFLSAMVIGIVWLFEFFHLRLDPFAFTLIETVHPIINKLVIGFACFAFLISFAREIIKDLQDVEGDRASGCRTLPVVIGINKSRILAVLVILITMFCLAYFQFILIGNNISVAAWYLCLVQALLISTVVVALFKKPSRKIFGIVSTLLKIAMITGICSMIFIPMI